MSLLKIEEQDYEGNVYHKTTSADIVIAKDTAGLAGKVGENSNVQTLLDKLTDRVVNKLIEKGLIVDNFATQIKGFIPDATLVTQLKETQDEQNKNINGNDIMKHLPLNTTNLNPFNIDDTRGNWIAGFANENMEGTFPHTAWQNIVQFDTCHFISQLSFDTNPSSSKDLYLRNKWDNAEWQSWNKIITNSDLPVLESLVINPLGKDQVQLDLKFNTNSYSVIAFNADFVAFDGFVIGSNMIDGTNKLNIRLSKAHSGQVRINIVYMRA